MVYKTIEVTKKVKERHKYCDICGEEINMNLACCSAKCMYCGKDLCDKHIGHEEDTYDDSRVVYCENCWKIGESYRPVISRLREDITVLYMKWQDNCKKDDIEKLI